MSEIVVVLLIAITVWGILIYNRLVRDKNRALAAWSDIDVQLKRRYDLIPKLIGAVKQYANHERTTVEAITKLRVESERSASISERGRLETDLSDGLHRLIAVAEDYPALKANDNFLASQRDLTYVENHIQYARRYYNGAVRNLNTRIDSFPDLLVANTFRFQPPDYFELNSPREFQSLELGA